MLRNAKRNTNPTATSLNKGIWWYEPPSKTTTVDLANSVMTYCSLQAHGVYKNDLQLFEAHVRTFIYTQLDNHSMILFMVLILLLIVHNQDTR